MFGKTALTLSGFGLLSTALPGHGGGGSGGGYGSGSPSSPVQTQPAENLLSDPLTYGPELELVHLYYDEFPTGIAVSKEGRMFSNYPGGLDANNTNNGQNGKYTIAELFPDNTERPYPSAEMNNPPGGAINYTTYPPTGANYQDYLIGSQSCVIDAKNRLWILDTGRVLTPDGTLVGAAPGGPKLIGVDLSNDQVISTIVFPPTVAYADSYLNDVRFDLRPESAPGGEGVAYITDSSVEGRNGLIIVDLGSGKSWRHLDGTSAVAPQDQWLASLWGNFLYNINAASKYIQYTPFGSDGIALSADGATLYWKSVAGRWLYAIPTERLLDNSPGSEVLAQGAITRQTETGSTDGMETDTNGFIYHGYMEQDAIAFFNPENGTDTLFVRDPRLNWIDTFATGFDGYLYFTNNQLVFSDAFYPGTDRRQRPFSVLRVPLPNGASKPILT